MGFFCIILARFSNILSVFYSGVMAA